MASSSLGAWPPSTWRCPFSVAPASTIAMSTSPDALRLPATTSSKTDSSSSSNVGKGIHSPSFRASRTAPIGPRNGIGLRVSAAEAAFSAATS